MASQDEVTIPASRLKEELAGLLAREGYVRGYRVDGEQAKRMIVVELKYGADRETAISGLRRVSKPGRRVYVDRTKLPRVQGGLGVAVISTSQGVLTDRQAARRGVGGEVLCYVW
jgi:small subunit ribosomal protein S8